MTKSHNPDGRNREKDWHLYIPESGQDQHREENRDDHTRQQTPKEELVNRFPRQ